MAEAVQYHLEQMVPELEDLERKKLFTKVELKAIVKKRTKFEYSLKRRQVARADFLRYIEYEINVDLLRKKRKQRLGIRGKTTISDYSIEQRVLSLFERALVRHSKDLNLWIQYIEYVKGRISKESGEANTRLLSKLYVRGIQAHPFEVRLWLMAASFEFEVNGNGSAARLLLQRALRLNPKEKKLWLEYFRLELLFIEKIKARRRILGIDNDNDNSDQEMGEEGAQDDNVIQIPTLQEEKDAGLGPLSVRERFEESAMAKYAKPKGANLSDEQRSKMATESNPVLQGAVARIIYEQAIQNVPNDLDFREQFAAIYTQFPNTDEGRQRVLESIKQDFADDVEARAYLCVAHLANANVTSPEFVDHLRLAVENYKQALADLDTKEMWSKYAEFLTQWRDVAQTSDEMQSLYAYFNALIKRAFAMVVEVKDKRLTPRLALQYADVLSDDNKEALLNWLADATKRFPQNEDLWYRRLSLLLDTSNIRDVVRLEKLVDNEAISHNLGSQKIWDLWFDWVEQRFVIGDVVADYVQAKYLAALVRVAQLSSGEELKSWLQIRFVNWAYRLPANIQLANAKDINISQLGDNDDDLGQKIAIDKDSKNLEAVRRAYQNVIRHAFPTLSFYSKCLDIESDFKPKVSLYELACRLDESDQEPWLRYIKFMIDSKKLDLAANVFWRASKNLPSDSERNAFDQAYQSLLQNN
ncbi:U3 snoRNP protein [Dipsacomyces acuminosporus]|nr:U3 snoRNP protein [Dipsacomyces acuminosporus]